MIRLFIRQHLFWLLVLLLLQLLVNVLLLVDAGVEQVSAIYLNSVWLVVVLLCVSVRFVRDYKIYNSYEDKKESFVATVKADYEQQLAKVNVQLQEQKLMLLERQDEMLAWVHEMKAPLTAMQLLAERIDDDRLKEKVEAEWLRLHLLLDQQLHATRLMGMEQDSRVEQVNVRACVVQEVRALRSWCFEKQIAVELELDDEQVRTDAKWLGFIVRQILSNAVKYSNHDGSIRIFMEANALYIEDHGCGIRAEDLPRVFRKSYTGTLGRETSAATGMGLYLAKQAADFLHIQLTIDSKVNSGTTAAIIFPQENAYVKTFAM